jgi:hypothetical protein
MIEQIKLKITEKSVEITTLKDNLSRAQREMATLQSELRAAKVPVVGDRKTVERFAFLPVVADNRWVWLRRYYDLMEYKKTAKRITITHDFSLPSDNITTKVVDHTDWVLVDRTVYPY